MEMKWTDCVTMIPYMTEGPFGLDLEGKMMTYLLTFQGYLRMGTILGAIDTNNNRRSIWLRSGGKNSYSLFYMWKWE